MLGGGHVRRLSVASVIDASPCVRVEKKKHTELPQQQTTPQDPLMEARITEKPSIASSYKFGGDRMIRAQRGLYERQSLEDSCLVGSGEDLSISREWFSLVPQDRVLIPLHSSCTACILSSRSCIAVTI